MIGHDKVKLAEPLTMQKLREHEISMKPQQL